MICKNCGAENPDGNMFCSYCGLKQEDTNNNTPEVNPVKVQGQSSNSNTESNSNNEKSGGGLGIASLVCGIICILLMCTGWIGAILGVLAIIFGCVEKKHNGIRTAGLVTGGIGLAISIIMICIGVMVGSFIKGDILNNLSDTLSNIEENTNLNEFNGRDIWDVRDELNGRQTFTDQLNDLVGYRITGRWTPSPLVYFVDSNGNFVSEDYQGEKYTYSAPVDENNIWEFNPANNNEVYNYLNTNKSEYVRGNYIVKPGYDGFKMIGLDETTYKNVKANTKAEDNNILSIRITPSIMKYNGQEETLDGTRDYIWVISEDGLEANVVAMSTGTEYRFKHEKDMVYELLYDGELQKLMEISDNPEELEKSLNERIQSVINNVY